MLSFIQKSSKWDTEILELVLEKRVPVNVVDEITSVGVELKEVFRLIVTSRTLSRRKEEGFLNAEESDRAMTLCHILSKAFDVFEDRDKALSWLRNEKKFLNGIAPIDVLHINVGASLVEERLNAIEHGMF